MRRLCGTMLATLVWSSSVVAEPRAAAPAAAVSPADSAGSMASGADSSLVPAPAATAVAPAPHPSPPHVIRTDTTYVLPTVRVRGKRATAREMPSTGTIVRVEGEDLRRFDPTTVADALAAVPGVDVVKNGAWDAKVSIRGLSGDRVLVMVDGVPLNAARGHGPEASLVALDQVDAIEVAPAANSSRYGSGALGGVVNISTRQNLFRSRPAVTFSVGSRLSAPGEGRSGLLRFRYGSAQFGAEISGGLGRLSAVNTANGAIPNSGYDDEQAAARVSGRLGRWLLEAEHRHTRATDIGLPAFGSGGGSGSYPERGREATRVETRWIGAGRWRELRLRGDSQWYRSEFSETTLDSVFVRQRPVGTRTTVADDHVRTTSRGGQLALGWALPLELRVRGDFRREATSGPRDVVETVRDASGTPTSETHAQQSSVPVSSRETWAAGFDAAQDLPWVRLEAGARYDRVGWHADGTTDGRFTTFEQTDARPSFDAGASGRLGFVQPYLHAGTGFRSPNLDERYFNGFIHGNLHLFGNADLKPENSRSFEIGVRTAESRGWLQSARATLYRTDVDEMITFRYVGQLYLVPRFQYVNVARARLEGLELSARLNLTARGTLGLDAGFPRGIDRFTRARLDEVGPTRVTLETIWHLPRFIPAGSAGLRARWCDATTEIATALERPSFWSTAATLGCEVVGFEVDLNVQNLLDADYQEPLSLTPEPGRTFALTLRRDFSLTPTQ